MVGDGCRRQKERERMVKGMESRRLKYENREVRVRFQEKHAGLLTKSHSPLSFLPQLSERDISNFAPKNSEEYCCPEGMFDP